MLGEWESSQPNKSDTYVKTCHKKIKKGPEYLEVVEKLVYTNRDSDDSGGPVQIDITKVKRALAGVCGHLTTLRLDLASHLDTRFGPTSIEKLNLSK